MTVTRAVGAERVAYELELGDELGSLHADGRCLSFKHAPRLVARLAAWWRGRLPASAKLAVFNDSTATPVYVQPGMTADEVLEHLAAVEAEWQP